MVFSIEHPQKRPVNQTEQNPIKCAKKMQTFFLINKLKSKQKH